MLRSFTLASAAVLALAGPALAQPADAWNWTGPYVGVNAGYGGGEFQYPFSGTTDANGTNPVAGRLHQNSSGGLGGGQIGYNIQGYRGLLFGIEADIDATDIGGRSDFYSNDSLGVASSGGADSKINYLGTVRGRIGAPMFGGRVVPYVTGGFAYGGVRTSAGFGCSACADGGGFDTGTHTQTGWTVGAGVEYGLTRHLSFKAEYLYVDLGEQDLSNYGGAFDVHALGLYNADVREKTDANLIRAGLNYRF